MASNEPAAVYVPIESIQPWSRNPRLNDGEPTARVAASIRRFGFTAPIVVWKSKGQIVAGHTRAKALAMIQRDDPGFVANGCPAPGVVPVRFHEFATQHEADAYALADNKIGEVTPWDQDALSAIVAELTADGVALGGLGFTDEELTTMIGEVEQPPTPDTSPQMDGLVYRVVVDVADEGKQAELVERLESEGYRCAPLIS